jgi:hypothetical protein
MANQTDRGPNSLMILMFELLGEEDSNDAQYNINDRILVQVMEFRQLL